jgi:DNA-binding beta-propeller fold protein YncE
MKHSEGKLRFEVEFDWGRLPEGWKFTQVAGVAVDSEDRVYVFNRSSHPVIVFDRDGKYLNSWGEGVFTSPHGIYIDPDDHVYCVDGGDHTVRKFTLEGNHILTLGMENQPGEEGTPFNRPTGIAQSPSGDMYISDGYGNSRVHVFSREGTLLFSWGSHGDGSGQFDLPHGIWVDRDSRVFVADRQNHRIQIFTSHGEYIDQWTGFRQPCTVFMDRENNVYVPELQGRMSILDINGELLARWGGKRSHAPGQFFGPHCAWVDSHGDLYIGEVLEGQRIQKFVRKN